MLDTLELLEAVGSDASLRYLDAHAMSTHFATEGALTLSKAMVSNSPRSAISADFGGEGNREPNHVNGVFVEYMEVELTADLRPARSLRDVLALEFGGDRNREPNLVDHVFIEAMEADMTSDLKSAKVDQS